MKALFLLVVIVPITAVAQDLTWPDPIANHVIPMQSTPVTHGPVLGYVTSSSVRVWLRADREIEFDVLVSPFRPPFEKALVKTATTNPLEDFTGFAEVTGLKPNAIYAYAIRVNGDIVDTRGSLRDPWPTFRTLPDKTSFAHKFNPQSRFNLSFSIGACQRQRSPDKTYGIYENPPAFNTIWERA